MDVEEWQPIETYPNYCVSNEGRVKNCATEKILKLSSDSYGYPQVVLSNNGIKKAFLVHRLVATAFVDGRDYVLQVNHIDGDKTNNRFSNLEWVSPSENTLHAYRTGLAHKSARAGTPPTAVRVVETGQIFNSESECARTLGIKREGINACINGRLRKYRGLHFERIT